MKLSGPTTNFVCPAMDGSSVKQTPLNETGSGFKLNTSYQSSPVNGLAIHSFKRRSVALPNTAGAALAADGVGALSNVQTPLLRPIVWFSIWNPYSTESTI